MDVKEDMNKNEIKTKLRNENDINNIGNYLFGKTKNIPVPLLKENLYYFFSNKNIYNEKGTKIKSQEDYLALLNILSEYIKDGNEFILLYFKKINIDLIKILFNGYISLNINDITNKEFALKVIKDIILLFFSNDLFYLIYNKLSKIFRRFNLIEDKEKLFNKFCNLFDLWKLIYNIDNREKINSNFFSLIGQNVIFLVYLNKYKIKDFNIQIDFEENFSNINLNNNELINISSFDSEPKVFKFKDIIKENKEKLISSKIYNDILYEDIQYYGGMESFIPIIKIIKYFISAFKENEDIIQKLNEILINIIKQIIQFIFYSKINFENFKNILVPLLSALAEINQVIPPNMKNNLYSNSIFSLLYIIIISSSLPFAIKKSYMKITELYNINKLNLNFEEIIIDVNKLRINSYEWHVTILIVIIEFILLSFNDIKKVPKSFINQISIIRKKIGEIKDKDLEKDKIKIFNYVRNSILSLNYIFKFEKDEKVLFENCEIIDNISKYFEINIMYNLDIIKLPLVMIQVYLNLINFESFWFKFDEEKIEMINDNDDKDEKNYKNIFLNFFNAFKKISNETSNEIKDLIRTEFEDYRENQEYLIKIFPFLKNSDFNFESELILSELIDFHKDYHKLMKKLFTFNKLWSDKKLFFTEEKKKKYLKYKSINYYTKNYLKPFLFPDLDYKYSYPKFSKFKIDKDLYIEEENTDEYNFNLECQEFDNFNINYEENILKKIEDNPTIISFDVCMVKRTHHVKGKLFVFSDNKSLIKKIKFYSYPPNIAIKIPGCNTYNKKIKDKINEENSNCFGSIFKCPEKDMNTKIEINIKDIRMILRKIYFYRKSAVEIFTKNKSYFFNFSHKTSKEKNCEDFTNLFACFISEFYPIGIKTEKKKVEIIGYSRQFE